MKEDVESDDPLCSCDWRGQQSALSPVTRSLSLTEIPKRVTFHISRGESSVSSTMTIPAVQI